MLTRQRSPTFLAPGVGFTEDNASPERGWGGVSERLKHLPFIVHFITVIIAAAAPQIPGR